MDIVKKKKAHNKKWMGLAALAIGIFCVLAMDLLNGNQTTKIDKSSIVLGTVKQGNLNVTVDGYGVLRSNKQKLISAQSPATVNEILLRPGASVKPESIILRMQDPDLIQQIESSEMELTEQQANLRRQKLANQRELLSEEATFEELNSDHQSLVLRWEAEKNLRELGVVPELDVKTAKLEEMQLAVRLKLQGKRMAQLQQLHKEEINISQAQINQAASILARLKERRAQLTVRAGISGVLQRLPISLGQSVIAGQELAQVGSSKDLQALIRVSQSKVDQIEIGQPATVNTRRESVAALVSRITPQVQDGTIEVELTFVDGIPDSARPELSVDAIIHTQQLENTLYVERPSNSQPHSTQQVFMMTQADQTMAQSHTVSFGIDAGRYVQVTNGLQVNQQIILSDMSQHKSSKAIRVIR